MASDSAGLLPLPTGCRDTFKSQDECYDNNKKEAHTVSLRNITTSWFTIVFIPFGMKTIWDAVNPTYYTHYISCTFWSVANHEYLFVTYDRPSKTLPFTIQLTSVPRPVPTISSACYLRRHKPVRPISSACYLRRHKPVRPICNKHVLCLLSDTSISIHDSHEFRYSEVRKVTIGRVFLLVLPFSSVSIIPSKLHTQLSLNSIP